MLGLSAGDTLTLQDGDSRSYELLITGVSENYASHFVYLSAEYYEEVFGKAPSYNSVIIDLTDRDDWAAASESCWPAARCRWSRAMPRCLRSI